MLHVNSRRRHIEFKPPQESNLNFLQLLHENLFPLPTITDDIFKVHDLLWFFIARINVVIFVKLYVYLGESLLRKQLWFLWELRTTLPYIYYSESLDIGITVGTDLMMLWPKSCWLDSFCRMSFKIFIYRCITNIHSTTAFSSALWIRDEYYRQKH